MTTRVRRVSTDVQLPKDGSLVGTITLQVAGIDQPIVYSPNFGAFTDEFLYQAASAGLANRLSIAYSGITEPEEIVTAINDEIANFSDNKFVSRSAMVRKIKAPDIVVAWIMAKDQDPEDREVVAQHMASWTSRTDEQKAEVQNNLKVATKLEEIQVARRLAKKAKEAVSDEVLAI